MISNLLIIHLDEFLFLSIFRVAVVAIIFMVRVLVMFAFVLMSIPLLNILLFVIFALLVIIISLSIFR